VGRYYREFGIEEPMGNAGGELKGYKFERLRSEVGSDEGKK
jgi:hypothetical protein